jgi:CHRD domain
MGVTFGSYDQTFSLTADSTYNLANLALGGSAATAEPVFVAALLEGRTYFNIHTTAFPGGEIRQPAGHDAGRDRCGDAQTPDRRQPPSPLAGLPDVELKKQNPAWKEAGSCRRDAMIAKLIYAVAYRERRRRAKARRAPQAPISPGRPAPTTGPGTATVVVAATLPAFPPVPYKSAAK